MTSARQQNHHGTITLDPIGQLALNATLSLMGNVVGQVNEPKGTFLPDDRKTGMSKSHVGLKEI